MRFAGRGGSLRTRNPDSQMFPSMTHQKLRALALPLLAVTLPACGPATVGLSAGPGAIAPERGQVEEELVSASALNATVRPARRDVSPERLAQLRVPAGFEVTVFAEGLEQPRVIRAAPGGLIYVAEREAGRVRLLRDTDGDGRADVSRVVSEGLREELRGVHGLAVHDGWLYMVTETELHRARIQPDGSLTGRQLLWDGIPAGGQHPNRTIAIGPDGMLYLSIGSTCNACVEPMDEHATLMRMHRDGTNREIFAEGLRNTIGFDWHPVSGRLYGFDHNSDGRGNDWPPEELNHIQEGRHYGWPFCGGYREVDYQIPSGPEGMGREEFCATTEAPVLTYQGHAAPMQIVYYQGEQFPPEFRGDAFVTMRGSWNRNPPVGYEVVRVRFDAAGTPQAIEPFVGGWLIERGRAHFGRLMGIAVAEDGALLVTDDTNGVVYRIAYTG
jgi:glucose/arabinose dehydrogenase